jgi:hypothetical protein
VSKVRLLSNNKSIFTLIVSMLIIIIMDSSLTIFCTPRSSRIINISNTELYFIYSIIFIISNIVLFNIVNNIKSNLKNKYFYFLILIVQSLLSIILLTIYGQMILYSNYSNLFIFIIVYTSFLSSIGFLSILTIKLLRWFWFTPKYYVLLYGIAISIFILNTIIGLVYLTQALSTHTDLIKPASCRVIFASISNINPNLSIYLSNLYDICLLQ